MKDVEPSWLLGYLYPDFIVGGDRLVAENIRIDSSSIVDHAMAAPDGTGKSQILVGKNCVINGELISIG
jgi:hypothetical protein